MDFTLKKYVELLNALVEQKFNFQTFEEFLTNPTAKSIVLRHDVDSLPGNSYKFAKIQAGLGIKGVYYFRAVPWSWDVDLIKKISALGHEIGYHYECLTTCKGDLKKGIEDFNKNLVALRQIAPVTTICMHGSPRSKFDSKDLWKHFDYKDYGILGEPYFDVDFNKVFYLTDTGRRWDGFKVSVRDKVKSGYELTFNTTHEIIKFCEKNNLPDQTMITFHPQRWNDSAYMWTKELILQNIKNFVKKVLYVKPQG